MKAEEIADLITGLLLVPWSVKVINALPGNTEPIPVKPYLAPVNAEEIVASSAAISVAMVVFPNDPARFCLIVNTPAFWLTTILLLFPSELIMQSWRDFAITVTSPPFPLNLLVFNSSVPLLAS